MSILLSYLTIYNCERLVRCKYHAIRNYCGKRVSTYNFRKETLTVNEIIEKMKEELEDHFTYPDLAEIAMGKHFRFVVESLIIILQFGLAVSCHILFGYVLFEMIIKMAEAIQQTRREFLGLISDPITLTLLVVSPLPLFVFLCYFKENHRLKMLSYAVPVCVVFMLLISSIDIFIGECVPLSLGLLVIYISPSLEGTEKHLYL